ncbi:hypothetical protein [Streptomyces sp. LN499]|uniref:hypothetical protein n=1 Tax=Streptomyces sp. LN499 TaxID=3112977 RepID=UPI00372023E4
MEGHGQPDVGVGVRHERAALGRSQVRAVRDLRAHVRVRIGDECAALGGSEVCALRDPAPYLRIRVGGQEDHRVGREGGVDGDHRLVLLAGGPGEDALHHSFAEGAVEQQVGAGVARSVRERTLHPRRILIARMPLSRLPDLDVGVCEEGGPHVRGQ